MPTKPKTLCSRPGCNGLVDDLGCSVCGKKRAMRWADSRRGTAAERGYGNDWRKLRNRYIKQNAMCERCIRLRDELREAVEVHHKQPFHGLNDPLRLDWNNLESLCEACHAEITAKR
jgi:5-methylcytosine-specific restriction protein A